MVNGLFSVGTIKEIVPSNASKQVASVWVLSIEKSHSGSSMTKLQLVVQALLSVISIL